MAWPFKRQLYCSPLSPSVEMLVLHQHWDGAFCWPGWVPGAASEDRSLLTPYLYLFVTVPLIAWGTLFFLATNRGRRQEDVARMAGTAISSLLWWMGFEPRTRGMRGRAWENCFPENVCESLHVHLLPQHPGDSVAREGSMFLSSAWVRCSDLGTSETAAWVENVIWGCSLSQGQQGLLQEL